MQIGRVELFMKISHVKKLARRAIQKLFIQIQPYLSYLTYCDLKCPSSLSGCDIQGIF